MVDHPGAMSEEDPDREKLLRIGEAEKRLQFLREHFLPADVRASWIRIRRRMIVKAIRRRWKREARERRPRASRKAFYKGKGRGPFRGPRMRGMAADGRIYRLSQEP